MSNTYHWASPPLPEPKPEPKSWYERAMDRIYMTEYMELLDGY